RSCIPCHQQGTADCPEGFQSTRRLIAQRRASPHTIASYRDTFRLLLKFAEERLAKAPSGLTMEDLNAPFLGAFPGSLGEHPRKRRSEPQSALDCDPVVLSICCAGDAAALRADPTCAVDSQQAATTSAGGFSHPA